jgi:hypothetical protein
MSGCDVQYTYEKENLRLYPRTSLREGTWKRRKEKYIRAAKARIRVKKNRKERQKAKVG